jgi:hypothetical protein
VERLAAFCLQNVEDWYAIAVREQGKESPAYFAEKNLLRYPRPSEPVSELYPDAKELFLVRDFRDVACSYISFHRRYGRDADEHIRATMPKLARRLIAEWRDRRADAHLVHYEDLVSEPVRTLEGIAHYLEIDSAQHTIGEMLRAGSDDERFRSHGTSPALEETVGRWRREGDESFRDQLNDAYRGPLAELGYTEDTTGATGGPRSAR